LAFWQENIEEENSILHLPFKKPPRKHIGNYQRLDMQIDEQRLFLIKEFCQKQELSLFMFLISIYQLLLLRLSVEDGVNIGIPVSGRNLP